MLKKINRLSNFKTGARKQIFDTPLFRIKTFSEGEGEVKFGFVVSKKIDKRAVVRNKTKRVFKKISKNFLPEIKKGKKIIFFAKTKLDFTKEKQLERTIRIIFKKAGLI